MKVYIPADECVFDEAFPANIQKKATGGGGGGKRNQRKPRKSLRVSVEASVNLVFFLVESQKKELIQDP